MQHVPGTIQCWIRHHENYHPFSIQPRCRLSRLYQRVGEGLCLQITQVQVKRGSEPLRLLEGEQKYLIEDLDVQEGDVLVVAGTSMQKKKKKKPIFPCKMVQLVAVREGKDGKSHSAPVHVAASCTVEMLQQQMQKSLQDASVSLWHQGQRLSDGSQKVLDLGVKDGDRLVIKSELDP